MSKLLRAGIRRYLMDVTFWMCMISTILIAKLTAEQTPTLGFDEMYIYLMFGLFIVLISWNIGKEHEEGTFRNKIIAGHSKVKIFISEMLLAWMAILVLFVTYSLVYMQGTKYILDIMPTEIMVKLYIGFMLANIAMVSLIVTITTLLSSRGMSAIINIVFLVGVLIAIQEVEPIIQSVEYEIVAEGEFIDFTYTDGTVGRKYVIKEGTEKKIYNPDYVGGWPRLGYELFYNSMPACQMHEYIVFSSEYWDGNDVQVREEDYKMMDTNIYFAIGVAIFMTGLGCFVFKRVDMK